MVGFKDTNALKWIVAKLKSVTNAHDDLYDMVMSNHFTANLMASSTAELADENGATVVADWEYDVASGTVGDEWTLKVDEGTVGTDWSYKVK